jgi:chorismate mutase/prephenate dehydratase
MAQKRNSTKGQNMSQEDLSRFRAQIDAIDDKIIDLLKDRMEIVKQVGEHKAKNSATSSFIRAGREASMLRNLTKKADGKFPPAAIATIWRMIISTSLCTEQNMSISAYASKDQACYWLAREYFGAFVKTERYASTDKVIGNVANGKTSIGILPLIDNSPSPWWIRPSTEKNDIYIFARIPFIEDKDPLVPPVLAIANVMPEQTDDDISVIAMHTKSSISDITTAFKNCSLNANIIATKNNTDYLIEVDKFLKVGESSLNDISSKLSSGSFLRLMGAYAAPIGR